MSHRDDDILALELGKLAESWGELGGLLSGGGSAVGKASGSVGAQFAAKFLATESRTEKLALKISPEKALKLGFSWLTKHGELQTESSSNSPYPLLKAVMRSGYLNMNPAVVYLEILEGGPAWCEVTVTAMAKEGLIKQNTASKAVQRVVSGLEALANSS